MKAAPEEYLIEFAEEGHEYYVNGERKRSVTQVLLESGVVDSAWYTAESRKRGTEVHAITAQLDTHGEAVIPPERAGHVKAWTQFCLRRGFMPQAIEQMVYDSGLDVCGRLDRRGTFEDDPLKLEWIVDLKTTTSGYLPKAVALQTAAYGHAIDPRQIFGRMAVSLFPDGTFHVTVYEPDTYLEHVADFAALVQGIRVREKYV